MKKKKKSGKKTDWESKAKEYLAGWKRAKADFANFKKDMEQRQSDWSKQGSEETVAKILPILDGLQLLTRELKRELNLELVQTNEFDPRLHEAVAGKGEKIVEVVSPGYKCGNKIIRPARVKLGE